MSNVSDFIIKNGVLTKYVGPGGDVVIPEGVTEIGADAFCKTERMGKYEYISGNTTLTSISLPMGLTKIGENAFSNCVLLTNIEFPGSLKEVGAQAFSGSGLIDVCIPKGVRTIGEKAFSALGNSKLINGEVMANIDRETVHHVKLCGTPKMGKVVFGNSFRAEEFYNGTLNIRFEMAYSIPMFPLVLSWTELPPMQKTELFLHMLRTPERFRKADVDYIAAFVRKGQKTLFPELCKAFGPTEMQSFLNFGMVDETNETAVLDMLHDKPEERAMLVKYVSEHITEKKREAAFENEVERKIEKQVNRNKALEEAVTLFEGKKPAEVKKEWETASTADGLRIEKYKGKDVSIVIPAMIGKTPVVEIAANALRAAADETGKKNAYQKKMYKNKCVAIRDGILRIGKDAFRGSVFLTDAVIPASVTQIGDDAFADCHKLTIHAPAGSYAEQYAKEHNIPFAAE